MVMRDRIRLHCDATISHYWLFLIFVLEGVYEHRGAFKVASVLHL